MCPKASVLTNGLETPFFGLMRGQKQGDPLSPLLFTIFLEPLAVALRADTGIKGVWGGGTEHKLFLYADDSLLLISDPGILIPRLKPFLEYLDMKLIGRNWR